MRSRTSHLARAAALVGCTLASLTVGCRSGAPLRVAYAGDAEAPEAQSAIRAIRLAFAELNDAGGIHGRPLLLEVYDDRNDPATAAENARKIVAEPDTVAVVGHDSVECSRRAGEIYAEAGILALGASPGTLGVTEGNDWYFRTSYGAAQQAQFLVTYARAVLDATSLGLIHGPDAYSLSLARQIEEAAVEAGAPLAGRWSLPVESEESDAVLEAVAREAAEVPENAVLVLAAQPERSARLLRLLEEQRPERPLMLTDAFASSTFLDQIDESETGELSKGRLERGLLMASPFLYDIGGEGAQQLRDAFVDAYEDVPGVWDVHAYDAANILAEILRRAEPRDDEPIAGLRARLRDQILALDDPSVGTVGISGPTFFDANGNAQKALLMAVVRSGRLAAAPVQLRPLSLSRRHHPQLDPGRIIELDGEPFYRTDVVRVGALPDAISDLDVEQRTFGADLTIWFRHDPRVDVRAIELVNGVESLELGAPIDEWTSPAETYSAYRVRGRFRMDTIPPVYGEHNLGIMLRHRELPETDLIFAIDNVGMDTDLLIRGRIGAHARPLLAESPGWAAHSGFFFLDVAREPALGHPSFDGLPEKSLSYSRFNFGVRIRGQDLSLRRQIPRPFAATALWTGAAALAVLIFAGRTAAFGHRTGTLWLLQAASATLLLIAGEIVLGDRLQQTLGPYLARAAMRVFDVLWWLVPAVFVNAAVARFLWRPLESHTGRQVPTVIKYFATFFVFLMAGLGIIAFVFGQKLTSLLATGGVVAMIIGLAVQINITNIFAGIAINVERPFQIGDWIKVHGRSPDPQQSVVGRVVDIGWRTTRLLTADNSMVVIPNGVISEKTVTNFNRPSEESRFEASFYVGLSVPTDDARRVLLAGVQAVVGAANRGPLPEPPPQVRVKGLSELGVEYEVAYTIIPREITPARARDVVTRSVLEHLRKAELLPAEPPRGA